MNTEVQTTIKTDVDSKGNIKPSVEIQIKRFVEPENSEYDIIKEDISFIVKLTEETIEHIANNTTIGE